MIDGIHGIYKFLSSVPVLNIPVKRWKINRDFSTERHVLKGRHQSRSSHQSILFFSLYRAGSTFAGSILKRIAQEASLTPVDLDGYFFSLGKGREWEGQGRVMLNVPYERSGYFYGPFRSFNRGIPNIEDYKIVLVLRDPRDVTVSSYYAIYSHVTPLMEGKRAHRIRMKRRKKRLEKTVDEFAIDKLSNDKLGNPSRFLDRYYEYHKELIGKPNVLFLKYEEMVGDFDNWLDRLVEFLDIGIGQEFIQGIKAENHFNVSREDIYKHKRQVTPGDHKRKLKPETVELLNSRTAEIRKLLGYE